MLGPDHGTPKRRDTIEFHSLAVQRVIGAIRARLGENVSLSEMARVAYMSRYHFNRTFRQVTGLPPRRFFSRLRVEAATRMLLTTDSSVTDICLDVGYTSLGTFIRTFSAILGISPMGLRTLRRSSANDIFHGIGSGTRAALLDERGSVAGRIECPPPFNGPIFIGLFSTAIPEGKPAACAILSGPGEYLIRAIRKGRYYLFALGLPWPDSLDGFFRYEAALRGGGQIITVQHDTVQSDVITLRAVAATDPPVLLNLPLLLGKGRTSHEVSSA